MRKANIAMVKRQGNKLKRTFYCLSKQEDLFHVVGSISQVNNVHGTKFVLIGKP